MRSGIKLIAAALVALICIFLAKSTFAHGSETGHNNGNGHDKTHETGGGATGTPINVDNAVGVNTHVGIDNRVDSVSGSSSSSVAGGAETSVDISQGGSAANVGAITATVGDVQTGSVTSTYNESEAAAATAATIIPAYCQSGMSGQGRAGGFAVINSEQLCDYWAAAKVALDAYNLESKKASCSVRRCEVASQPQCNIVEAEMRFCPSPEVIEYHTKKAIEHYRRYEWNLSAAQSLLEATEGTATADRMAGQLVRPAALLALLIFAL